MLQVYDLRGRRVVLGGEIGRGSEGAVYEIGDTPNLLAKIYEKEVSSEKAAKLTAMARMINPALLAISAWPTDILYDRSGGQLRGFLMPRVLGHHEIHVLYSPAQRKLEFPKADWKFLVHVARNLAAAIETVHAHFVIQVGIIARANTGLRRLGKQRAKSKEQKAKRKSRSRGSCSECFGFAVCFLVVKRRKA